MKINEDIAIRGTSKPLPANARRDVAMLTPGTDYLWFRRDIFNEVKLTCLNDDTKRYS